MLNKFLNQKDFLLKIINLSKDQWPILIKGFIFLIISSCALMAYPQYIKIIIDEALKSKSIDRLNFAAITAFFIFMIQGVTSSLRYYYFTLAGEKTVKGLREKLFNNIIFQELKFFDTAKTGELIGRLSADTAVLQNALSVNISMLFRNLFQALGGIILLFFTSFKLTIFILLIIPPLIFIVARFGKKIKVISKETQDSLAIASGIAQESISGIRTVKSFASEDFESKRYYEQLKISFLNSKNKIKIIATFSGIVSFIGFMAIIFIVWYGGGLVINGEISVGVLTSYILYVITVSFSVGMLGSLFTDFMSAFGAADRIFKLLEKNPFKFASLGENIEIKSGKIKFENVSFAYPNRKEVLILKNFNLNIKNNETIALVGPSGSGKSTLASLILGLYEINEGDILIDSTKLSSFNKFSLRRQIGIVSQEPILISESIYENIKYGNQNATYEEVINSAKLAFAHDFISSFPKGYNTLVGEKGVQLSGGQKQRVAIARAILKNPKILILDEATSALDSNSEHILQKAIDNLKEERTTIIIAHRLSTVKSADKIFVFGDGVIEQSGTHEDLIQDLNGTYNKLLEKQFE